MTDTKLDAEKQNSKEDKMNVETIYFKASDGVSLSGIIYKSKENADKILISVHGMASNCLKKRNEIIANKIKDIETDTLTFNNRGHDIINYIKKANGEKAISGTAFENVEDGYYDICGAVKYALEKGYKEIYLMGHSLGSTKAIYTYNKMIEKEPELTKNIKALIILSLVDIPTAVRVYLNDRFPETLKYAKDMEKAGMENILMPEGTFIHPVSVKTFLKYARDYQNIDFARYSDTEYDFKELNNIKIPLFMRWGNNKELILQNAEDLCKNLRAKIQNNNLDVNYIDGANHSYKGKEEQLASEIQNFLEDN